MAAILSRPQCVMLIHIHTEPKFYAHVLISVWEDQWNRETSLCQLVITSGIGGCHCEIPSDAINGKVGSVKDEGRGYHGIYPLRFSYLSEVRHRTFGLKWVDRKEQQMRLGTKHPNGFAWSRHTSPFTQMTASLASWWLSISVLIMTSSHESFFRVTGPLWGEFPGHRWIPQRTSNTDFDVSLMLARISC